MKESKYLELNDKKWLEQKYLIEKLSLRAIARLIDSDSQTVRYNLLKFKILIRSMSAALSGDKNPMYGRKHSDAAKCKIVNAQLLVTEKQLIDILKENNCKLISKWAGGNKGLEILCCYCETITKTKQGKNILRYKIFCKQCRRSHKKDLLLQRCQDICNQLKLKYVDTDINSVIEYHNFECSASHKIYKPLCELNRALRLQTGNGCKQCVADSLRTPLEDIKKRYYALGFEFLDDKFINFRIKNNTRCNNCGFIWRTNSSCILQHKSGCPECSRHINEKLTGEGLKKLLPNVIFLQHKYIKCNDKNFEKKYIYVDYFFELNNKFYIVEYNGGQHYKYNKFFHCNNQEKFKLQKRRDIWLKQYCICNNIVLINIDGRKVFGSKIFDFLKRKIFV